MSQSAYMFSLIVFLITSIYLLNPSRESPRPVRRRFAFLTFQPSSNEKDYFTFRNLCYPAMPARQFHSYSQNEFISCFLCFWYDNHENSPHNQRRRIFQTSSDPLGLNDQEKYLQSHYGTDQFH